MHREAGGNLFSPIKHKGVGTNGRNISCSFYCCLDFYESLWSFSLLSNDVCFQSQLFVKLKHEGQFGFSFFREKRSFVLFMLHTHGTWYHPQHARILCTKHSLTREQNPKFWYARVLQPRQLLRPVLPEHHVSLKTSLPKRELCCPKIAQIVTVGTQDYPSCSFAQPVVRRLIFRWSPESQSLCGPRFEEA